MRQLFDLNHNTLTDDILERYNTCGEKLLETFEDLWKIFLSAASNQETVVVIDALDECQEDDRKRLVDAIIAIYNRSENAAERFSIKFLLTSRPYEHIRRQVFPSRRSRKALIHLQGDSGPTTDLIAQEIQLVVDSRIEETADCLRL